MKYFDLFFMITYFILKKLGRDEDAAKWSAMLHTGVTTAISLTIVVGIIGIFKELDFLIIYMDKAVYYVLFCCSCCFIFYLRYFVLKTNIVTTQHQYKCINSYLPRQGLPRKDFDCSFWQFAR